MALEGAEHLTEPKDHGREIRAYIRDPDGHLIEVGSTGLQAGLASSDGCGLTGTAAPRTPGT